MPSRAVLTRLDRIALIVIKKLLLASALVLGLIYGSGSDLGAVKRSITGISNDNARGLASGGGADWGTGSGY